jgi:hypothetical protein
MHRMDRMDEVGPILSVLYIHVKTFGSNGDRM